MRQVVRKHSSQAGFHLVFKIFSVNNSKTVQWSIVIRAIMSLLSSGGILPGSVFNCLTRYPGVVGSSRTGFFVGVFLGKTLQSPSFVLMKPRKGINNVSCRRDMTEILLKAAKNTIQSINQFNWYDASLDTFNPFHNKPGFLRVCRKVF